MPSLTDQIAQLLQSSPDRDTAFKNILAAVLTHFQSETGTIHLLDTKTQLLQLTAQSGLPPAMLDVVKTIPVGKGIAGQAVARGGPVTICNLQTDNSGVAKPGARQTGVGGALCVPLRKAGAIVGTIGVGTMRPYEYTPEETSLLEEIGGLIGAHVGV